jgi:serine/threonine protein kinase
MDTSTLPISTLRSITRSAACTRAWPEAWHIWRQRSLPVRCPSQHSVAIVSTALPGLTFPQPLSPGKGYTWHVDYWSLGVCVFELLFSRRPFESRSADKLTQAIMKGSIKFPPGADEKCSKEGQSLVLSVSINSLRHEPLLLVPTSSSTVTQRRG